MNPAIFASLPASACTLGTAGSNGPDRIAKTIYDFAGQVTEQRVAVGTADAATESTLTYTNNGQLATLKDAENNLTIYEYDGHDRLSKTRFPNTTKGSGTSSTTDYEQLTYENTASSTRTSGTVATFRNRANETTSFTYDNLARVTTKNLPGTELDITYGYDNLNRLTSASQTGHALSFTYDALSRQKTETGPLATVTRNYDAAGQLSSLTSNNGYNLTYQRLVTGELTTMLDGGGVTVATFGYDNLGRRTSLTYGNGSSTAYAYDPVSRLTTLTNDLPGTANDLTIGSIAYNPASQIVSQNRSNDLYAWTGHGSGSTASVANGLNQLTSIGGSATAHDAKGNLTSDPVTGKTYTYSAENLLISASGGGTSATLTYDPLGRLYQVTSGATTRRFLYGPNPSNDSLPQVLTEYDGAGTALNHYGYGPGADEPLLWWDMPAGGLIKLFHADERGSIVAVTDATTALVGINTYDEYGKPGPSNVGRFQYTGQMWLGEIGLQYSKARLYDPRNGRFLQTDPIGYEAGTNLYAYVDNDPVNFIDPSGLVEEVLVIGKRPDEWDPWGGNWFFGSYGGGDGVGVGAEGGGGVGGPFEPVEDDEDDNPCAAPPISDDERKAAASGDRQSFWQSRQRRGDPLGATGLSIASNSSFWGQFANVRLRDAISSRSPSMSTSAISAEVRQIGIELMRAHVRAVDAFGDPSPMQIAGYHFKVLNAHRLPNTTFGGSMITGTQAEAWVTWPGWAACD